MSSAAIVKEKWNLKTEHFSIDNHSSSLSRCNKNQWIIIIYYTILNMGMGLQMPSDEKENNICTLGAFLCSFHGFVFVYTKGFVILALVSVAGEVNC